MEGVVYEKPDFATIASSSSFSSRHGVPSMLQNHLNRRHAKKWLHSLLAPQPPDDGGGGGVVAGYCRGPTSAAAATHLVRSLLAQ